MATEQSLLPPPTTIEELWERINARFLKQDMEMRKLRTEIEQEGDPWLHDAVVYVKRLYAKYWKTD